MGGLAQALTGQAAALSSQGSLAQSEPIFTEALDLAVAAVGPKGALTGTVLGGIAWAKHEQGLYRRAEELYRRQYDIYIEAREHPDAIFSVRPHGIVQATLRLGGVLVEADQ